MQTCPSSSLSLCISKSCSLVENTPLLMVCPHLLCQECSTPRRGIRWRLLCLLSGNSFQVSSSEKPSWTRLTRPSHSVMDCVCLSSICRCWNNSVYWFMRGLSLSCFLSPSPTRMSAPWKQGRHPFWMLLCPHCLQQVSFLPHNYILMSQPPSYGMNCVPSKKLICWSPNPPYFRM